MRALAALDVSYLAREARAGGGLVGPTYADTRSTSAQLLVRSPVQLLVQASRSVIRTANHTV